MPIVTEDAAPVASGVLDALAVCALVVDSQAAVRLASVMSVAAIRRAGSGVALRPAAPGGTGGLVLTALHREDAALLRRLIGDAARGGAGGSLRIRSNGAEDARESMQVAFVLPLPASPGLALVKIEDLVRRAVPSVATLSALFGFSRAEAEVALGLSGGAGAEEVAISRGVSLDTVRGQIRAILRKSDAANLRDFERLMATVAASIAAAV
ncbi:helix-turn-helix transcriptional regulator [Roseomonas fluvialis]|uniref:HTH luxR-type domain-containing protein n=1 Tax=Roseomonas fluvialis TaxID=1750527 RepID=A0ABN6NY97_9PROT|nr:hypothetical protein [Roseomonas fluvialis]BDG70428.1 hypothetical protein Rmf_03570 [Roseomonas fluvialis]